MESVVFQALGVGSLIAVLAVTIGLFGMAFGNWFFGRYLFKWAAQRHEFVFHTTILACLMIPFMITMFVAVEVLVRIYHYYLLMYL